MLAIAYTGFVDHPQYANKKTVHPSGVGPTIWNLVKLELEIQLEH